MEPITSRVPYMVIPGNHEASCQELLTDNFCPPGQFNFTAFRNRFRMPSHESGAGDVNSMWSSFDFGLIHFVLLNTETDFPDSPDGPGSALGAGPFGGDGTSNPSLLAWLQNDLQKAQANRQQVPWILVLGHRPVYASDNTQPKSVRLAFEQLFIEYKVDVYICGHVHYYERLYPIANGIPQVYAGNVYEKTTFPTYVINGAAGNDERHDSAPQNRTISAVLDDTDFGYSRIFLPNRTHLQLQFYHSSDRSLGDELWIVQVNR